MSCGQIALNKMGYTQDDYDYYASEIHQPSIKVTQHNFPNTIQLGDVTKVSYKEGLLYSENGDYNVGKIDLVMGGSPCQSISNLGKREGLAGKSGLFFHWLRIRDEINPDAWLLENVVGNKEAIKTISELLGTQPTLINSNLVSAQNRKRLYWTNKESLSIPADRGLSFKDIMDTEGVYQKLSGRSLNKLLSPRCRVVRDNSEKLPCLLAAQGKKATDSIVIKHLDTSDKLNPEFFFRYPTRKEMELAQTIPVGYTDISSYNQASEMLGNGWTVDVIVHILKQVL